MHTIRSVAAAAVILGGCLATALAQERAAEVPAVTEASIAPQKAGGALLVVKATAPVRFSTFRLAPTADMAERLVLDIENAHWDGPTLNLDVHKGGVTKARASQYTSVPPVVRVVTELLEAGPVRVLTESPAQEIRVAIGAIDPPGSTPPSGGGGTMPTGPTAPGPSDGAGGPEFRPEQPVHLTSVEVLPTDKEHVDFRIHVDGKAEPVFFMSAYPPMAVVDFPTAAPLATKGVESGWVPVNVPPVRGVPFARLGEVPEGSVLGSRLVIGLERPMPYDLSPDQSVPNAWRLSFRVSPAMPRIVVIDPGHGGRDSGALDPRNNIPEAELALAIGRRLRTELMNRGICAILTRTADVTVDLYHRPYLANELGAELFLAIHLNMGEPREGGVETYYTHEASKAFASAVHAAVVGVMKRPDRGVKLANFVVTRETRMPSTLAEIGFIDQADDLALMRKDTVQQQLAVALADAIETTLRAHPAPAH